jgi:hypothetical protein
MADQQAANGQPFDPMEAWRKMRDSYLDSWAKVMVETVNTDAYAKASGSMLDTYLSMSTPFRETVEKAMLQTLQQLSMPSRADFGRMAERMSNLELRLDDMDAKLDRIEQFLTKPAAGVRKATSQKTNSQRKGAK